MHRLERFARNAAVTGLTFLSLAGSGRTPIDARVQKAITPPTGPETGQQAAITSEILSQNSTIVIEPHQAAEVYTRDGSFRMPTIALRDGYSVIVPDPTWTDNLSRAGQVILYNPSTMRVGIPVEINQGQVVVVKGPVGVMSQHPNFSEVSAAITPLTQRLRQVLKENNIPWGSQRVEALGVAVQPVSYRATRLAAIDGDPQPVNSRLMIFIESVPYVQG